MIVRCIRLIRFLPSFRDSSPLLRFGSLNSMLLTTIFWEKTSNRTRMTQFHRINVANEKITWGNITESFDSCYTIYRDRFQQQEWFELGKPIQLVQSPWQRICHGTARDSAFDHFIVIHQLFNQRECCLFVIDLFPKFCQNLCLWDLCFSSYLLFIFLNCLSYSQLCMFTTLSGSTFTAQLERL